MMDEKQEQELFAQLDEMRAAGIELNQILSAFGQLALTYEDIPADKREEVSRLINLAAAEQKKIDDRKK